MRVAFVLLLLLAAATSGCLEAKKEEGGDGEPSGTASGTASGSASKSATRSGTGSTGAAGGGLIGNVTLHADVVNGSAPLAVDFTINATSGATTWRMSFGDGAEANGTGQPTGLNHTYSVGGNFTAQVTAAYPGGNVSANLTITVTVPPGQAGPDVTHFDFADSLGCVGDAGADTCITFNLGLDGNGIDGYWQALDERYWGLAFTTTVESTSPLADSDCAFTGEDMAAIIGDANNSSSPCAGTVPEGTAWIFLYPYAAPALSMTMDFTA